MRDRRLHALIVGLLLGAALSSCHLQQDEWDVPPPTSARRGAAPLSERGPMIDPVARGLFAKNCAACHGLDGSGQGPSVLDRPARNFKNGGFSFGNTADAIFNTISHGIPGTPMPAFGESLEESERRRLAAYVQTLGPSVEDVDVADTILAVTEESGPLVVRGILPPIVEGAPIRPRGMLVGLPGGLTFEYRIDDVRLLGVRQGGFVERTDWRDRGGTPLKPLGGLIWVDAGGDPPATFSMRSLGELTRRLLSTAGSSLECELVSGGQRVAIVTESALPIERGALSGFRQELRGRLEPKTGGDALQVRIALPSTADEVASFTCPSASGPDTSWRIFHRPDGVYECLGVRVEPDVEPGPVPLGETLELVVIRSDTSLVLGDPRVQIDRLFATKWSDGIRLQLQEDSR